MIKIGYGSGDFSDEPGVRDHMVRPSKGATHHEWAGVLAGLCDNLGSHRIEVDVPREFRCIFILIDQKGFVAALEQMTRPPPFMCFMI